MRLAILADVHSNLVALEAVLEEVDRIRADRIWCAGDLVGYNPWPNEVVALLRERRVRAIRGNHDRSVLSGDTGRFNEVAADAIRWTRVHLLPPGFGYLKGLEDRARDTIAGASVAMYHGSPRHDDEYVFPWNVHEELLDLAGADLVILGHTHIPLDFGHRGRRLMNPGSVGQPRDGDPRAAWGLLDTDRRTFHLYRVSYNVDEVAREIRRSGLPTELADRLYAGV